MQLKDYLSEDRTRRTSLSAALGVTAPFLDQLSNGTRPVPPARCVEIERATLGRVTRKDLRPDWALIWPELVD
ncbi:transcriptional regulator [Parvibium lacunae]|uniref:XRE family transcriptional regulator n=1 Tax=Parvibium lacunae TaxID=1888893 RepID=A0A368L7V4_9BURK|nr:YdaS family helix-turn-helix protein [Parvibium lacunae]RCS59733.1 hypothetical protein DU000_03220 [Parvibium lacunae]